MWGPGLNKGNLNGLFKSQKKLIRIVKNASYNAHTNDIFKELGILKLQDMIDVELNKLMYLATKLKLPKPLNNIVTLNSDVHQYKTRNRKDPRSFSHKSAVFNNSFLAKGPIPLG